MWSRFTLHRGRKAKQSIGDIGDGDEKSDAFGEVRLDSASVWVFGTESELPLALCVGFSRSSPGR